jgi:hypothetical protein
VRQLLITAITPQAMIYAVWTGTYTPVSNDHSLLLKSEEIW